MTSKNITFLCATVLSFTASTAMAETLITDPYACQQNHIQPVSMGDNGKHQVHGIAVAPDTAIDTSLGRYDAEYEIVLEDRGQPVGKTIYGHYDADYAAFLTPDNFFATAALGQHDAGYEVVLASRGQAVGTAVYGQNDADYDAYLTPANFFATAALGDYDADYEVVLEAREPLGARYFWVGFDYASLN